MSEERYLKTLENPIEQIEAALSFHSRLHELACLNVVKSRIAELEAIIAKKD